MCINEEGRIMNGVPIAGIHAEVHASKKNQRKRLALLTIAEQPLT